LAGLEQAIDQEDERLVEMAVRRIMLLHGVTLSIGGVPLLYLGEEWGMLNDYDFVKDPAKAGDTRWIHRPKMKWEYLDQLDTHQTSMQESVRRRIFQQLRQMISWRQRLPAIAGQKMELLKTQNPHLLGYTRSHDGSRLIVLANFADTEQVLPGNTLRMAGLGRFFQDVLADTLIGTSEDLHVAPYQLLWLQRA
jgi:amylosucrase